MRRILVTGANGGMGKSTVKALVDRGYFVYALDRGEKPHHTLTGECVKYIQADVTSESSLLSAFSIIKEECDSLFAIVNLAGIYMLNSLVEMREGDFRRIIDVNLVGVFLVNKTFLPLLHKGSRVVIMTSELAPLDPLPFTGIYAVSKGALDKYAYSLRMELQLLDIDVSVLRAGATETDMLGASTTALERFVNETELYSCNADRFKKIVDSVEARCIPPERVAEKIVRILNLSHPRFAYSINRNPLLLLLNILPHSLQLWVIKKILKNKDK